MSAKIIEINRAMQFRVSLVHSEPLIWRRIIVPFHYSFWDLHCAIQDAMGWKNYHLHAFEIKDPASNKTVMIGQPDEDTEAFGLQVLPDHLERISRYFSYKNKKAEYEYDFGDSWHHNVQYEKTLIIELGEKLPKCIDGQNACPPEDCGGIFLYNNVLSVMQTSRSKPKPFIPENVRFHDPKKILKSRNS